MDQPGVALGQPVGEGPEEIPAGIYTIPELAFVGLTEAAARAMLENSVLTSGEATLAAIEAGTLDELGVRAIWLTPFNTNPEGAYLAADGQTLVTGYHGYWPVRAREVDPRLGGADALEAMVEGGEPKPEDWAAIEQAMVRAFASL